MPIPRGLRYSGDKTAQSAEVYRETLLTHRLFVFKKLYDSALRDISAFLREARAFAMTAVYRELEPTEFFGLLARLEAPGLLAYSSRNRSASCRIPYSASPKGKRVEVRFPDPSANPYLAFAAMLMAGIDGIQNKIHPGDPMDKNLYDLPPEELTKVPTVAGSLREALNSLDADRTFLTKGGVFTDDQIDAYMELKWEEVYNWEHQPAPVEYKMYYSI
jgi:glutamine synthetase